MKFLPIHVVIVSQYLLFQMMGLFGKKKDPKEEVRELQRKMRQEMRSLDRQVYSIQREEQKVTKEIKEAAKKGDKDVCLILAKSMIQSRKVEFIYLF